MEMTTKKDKNSSTDVDIIPEFKNAVNFIEKYADKINKADKIWKEPIELNDPIRLREQIQASIKEIPDLSKLAAKAEKQYRDMQKEASRQVPDVLKSDARKMWLDGHCSDFRYQRDILECLFKGLNMKISAQKAILSSLMSEMRSNSFHE
jgi:hypothetical protein